MVVVDKKIIQVVLKFFSKGAERVRRNYKGFNNVMSESNKKFQQSSEISQALNKSLGSQANLGTRLAAKTRKLTAGFRGFKMEMLGVMFFGMAMQRVFSGLLKTSLDWVGVTEVMTAAFGILFLPVAELILNWALMFLDIVSNLTESQKKWIGSIVLIGMAIGVILFVLGTFALGIGSLIVAFGSLLTPIALVLGAFAAIAGWFVLKDFFKDLSGKSDELRGKLTLLGISGESFDQIKEKIGVAFEKIKEFFSGIGEKIGNFIGENLPKLIKSGGDLLIGLVDGVKNNVGKIAPAINSLIDKIVSFINENSSEIISAGLDILDAILKGIVDNLDKLSEVVKKIANSLVKFIGENSEDFVKIGWEIAKAIVLGIGDWFARNPGVLLGALGGGILGSLAGPAGTVAGAVAGAAVGFKQTIIPKIEYETPNQLGFSQRNPFSATNIVINNTTDVNVSDKSEFEILLEENNRRQTEELRRLGLA